LWLGVVVVQLESNPVIPSVMIHASNASHQNMRICKFIVCDLLIKRLSLLMGIPFQLTIRQLCIILGKNKFFNRGNPSAGNDLFYHFLQVTSRLAIIALATAGIIFWCFHLFCNWSVPQKIVVGVPLLFAVFDKRSGLETSCATFLGISALYYLPIHASGVFWRDQCGY
jgi:hypothetical protein